MTTTDTTTTTATASRTTNRTAHGMRLPAEPAPANPPGDPQPFGCDAYDQDWWVDRS